jgi:transcriptional regulator with XRE-family HTH domain
MENKILTKLKGPEHFKIRLSIRRSAMGMTQKYLAAKIGVAASSVMRYEKGRHYPPGDTIVKIARVLKCRAGWLLEGEGPEEEIQEPQQDIDNDQWPGCLKMTDDALIMTKIINFLSGVSLVDALRILDETADFILEYVTVDTDGDQEGFSEHLKEFLRLKKEYEENQNEGRVI